MFTLACLDMAGTTVLDDGVVEAAFLTALAEIGYQTAEQTRAFLIQTMGKSKVEVFTDLLGTQAAGEQGALAFEAAYAAAVRAQGAGLVPGTAEALGTLREMGVTICLTTGFAPATRDLLIESCGLAPLIDLAISPADTSSGRGRPAPDMILTAIMATGTTAVSEVVVAGDTSSDIASGLAAGAGMVVGVLTGVHDAPTLRAAGATAVLSSVAELPTLLG